MAEWGPETYGERWAQAYDAWVAPDPGDDPVAATVDVLAELARGGRALELGIGTGRVALPLADRGLEVYGIDASDAMVAELRRKTGGADIAVTIGNFADVAVDGTFDLVYAVFNTLFALPAQEEQRRCFRNVARHLSDDGVFVVECFTPALVHGWRDRQQVRTARIDDDGLAFAVSQHDPSDQTTTGLRIWIREGRSPQLLPIHLRYASPNELDLMAELAGFELRHRWGGWDRSPFGPATTNHISVYARRS
jgi:SAM-dependent methyltransferase